MKSVIQWQKHILNYLMMCWELSKILCSIKKLIKSRNIVYMCIYGVTRCNKDRWLQEVSNTWRTSKIIVELSVTQLRSNNGFVQENMLQKASTLLKRCIKTIMWNYDKEVICCKRKLEKEWIILCEIKINCHGFDVYLYTPASQEHALQQIRQSALYAL